MVQLWPGTVTPGWSTSPSPMSGRRAGRLRAATRAGLAAGWTDATPAASGLASGRIAGAGVRAAKALGGRALEGSGGTAGTAGSETSAADGTAVGPVGAG